MTKKELIALLESTSLFTDAEIASIVKAVGVFDIECAIQACEVFLDIKLTHSDRQIMREASIEE
jgi:hypothetical protein